MGQIANLNLFTMNSSRRSTLTNEVVKPIHPSRMPVILDAADYGTWLSGSPDEAARLLKPFGTERMHIAMEGGKADDQRHVVV